MRHHHPQSKKACAGSDAKRKPQIKDSVFLLLLGKPCQIPAHNSTRWTPSIILTNKGLTLTDPRAANPYTTNIVS